MSKKLSYKNQTEENSIFYLVSLSFAISHFHIHISLLGLNGRSVFIFKLYFHVTNETKIQENILIIP